MATKTLSKEEKLDVKLASSLILTPLLQDEGLQALQQAASSAADLPSAIALAIFQAMGQVRKSVQERGVSLSSKIWMARGGVVDQVVQNVCQALASVPPEMQEAGDPQFMQDVKEEIMNLMEGNGPPQQEAGGAPPEAGAPNLLAPQQAPPMGGM